MDVKAFADELVRALADTGLFERVSLQTEGPIANGRAHVHEGLFLRFYFNEVTGTIAFALIEKQQRIWGIDYDNRRGWHLHPADNPTEHVEIEPLSVSDIAVHLQDVLLDMETVV
ncbi:MAG: hypothetical protein FJ014_05420 [Chloroflexi bacterium]|nr:hypothetical protein [Chloroflexota bacterium]